MSESATITHKQQTAAWSAICDLEEVVAQINGLAHALSLMAPTTQCAEPAFTAIAQSIEENAKQIEEVRAQLFRALHPHPEASRRKDLEEYNPLLGEVSIH